MKSCLRELGWLTWQKHSHYLVLTAQFRCWRTISMESPPTGTSEGDWEHLNAHIWPKKSNFAVLCSPHSSTTVFPCTLYYHKPGIRAGSLNAVMGQLRLLMPTGLSCRTAKGSYLASSTCEYSYLGWFTVLLFIIPSHPSLQLHIWPQHLSGSIEQSRSKP